MIRRFQGLRRLLRIERGRATVDRAVDDELRFHFDMTMRELMAGGMTPDEARRETERRFGDVQRTRERLATIDRARVGQERRAEWWSAFAQDFRYALRGLRLKPWFAVAVILTLGLGIGANATMFGIVDRLLFRPPPFLDRARPRIEDLPAAILPREGERAELHGLSSLSRSARKHDVVRGDDAVLREQECRSAPAHRRRRCASPWAARIYGRCSTSNR